MKPNTFNRRKFFYFLSAGTAALALRKIPGISAPVMGTQGKPATNISDAAKIPRNSASMPGLFPGRVIHVKNTNAVVNDDPVETEAYKMIEKGMLEITGEKNLKKAWRMFVSPGERIGLKVNPVAGTLLTTSHAVTQSVIKQLTESGISRKNIIIWDRRDMQLKETGYTNENYPGIRITGTEMQDDAGGYYNSDGKLYGENNIDREWYYWADVDGEYDSETLPFMVNGGKYSYFTKIVTQEVDKIINIPILKNAGASITNAMKNLAFGSVSNTGRLHAALWNETCAEVCAFAPLRDKVVLNICDGLRGCFNGGPGASPEFICNYHSVLISSDPVAMDRIAYDIVVSKRIAEGIQKASTPQVLTYLTMASNLGLGISERERINLKTFDLTS